MESLQVTCLDSESTYFKVSSCASEEYVLSLWADLDSAAMLSNICVINQEGWETLILKTFSKFVRCRNSEETLPGKIEVLLIDGHWKRLCSPLMHKADLLKVWGLLLEKHELKPVKSNPPVIGRHTCIYLVYRIAKYNQCQTFKGWTREAALISNYWKHKSDSKI